MIPDNVEKIIMTKDDYDRNVEQLLFDKINAEKEIERLTNNWDELYEFLVEKSQNSINYETIYLDILDKMEKWR